MITQQILFSRINLEPAKVLTRKDFNSRLSQRTQLSYSMTALTILTQLPLS